MSEKTKDPVPQGKYVEKTKDPVPQGKYVPATRGGSLIFTAGMTPRKDGVLQFSGKVEAGEPLEKYREAARLAAANALTAARNRLEPGEKIARVLSMTVYVNNRRLRKRIPLRRARRTGRRRPRRNRRSQPPRRRARGSPDSLHG